MSDDGGATKRGGGVGGGVSGCVGSDERAPERAGRRFRALGGGGAGALLAAHGTLGWRAVKLATRDHVLVPPLLTGVCVHGRVVPAVTTGAEDGRTALVIDVGGRHGDKAWQWRELVVSLRRAR